MSDPVLQMENVSLNYGSEPVLTGINLAIQPGELTVIAGTSGCGKSTLLRGAIGLLRPSKGIIRLLGRDIANLDEEELAELRRRVGLLFQGGALINSMTIAENVALPVRQFSRLPDSVVDSLVRMKLAQVGLEDAMQKTPPELSGGMRKRAALARTLAMDPELLLCDEPSAGLDPVTAAALDRLLLDLRAAMNMTLVVVTHELGSIDAIADRVIMVAGGGLAFDGSLEQAHRTETQVVKDFFARKPAKAETRGRSILERLLKP